MTINLKKINNKKFSNIALNSFFGNLIKEGKGYGSMNLYIKVIEFLKINNKGREGVDVLLELLSKLKPLVGIRSKKVAGINYQLPSPITDERAFKMAVAWFFKSLDNRSEKTLFHKMSSELLDIKNNKGHSLQKKQYHEKLAIDNRPFLHFLKR